MRHIQLQTYFTFLLVIFATSKAVYAQTPKRICATDEVLKEQIRQNPDLIDAIKDVELHTQRFVSEPHLSTRNSIITIPVVIHVVYRAANVIENISDEQILSQLNVLNKDYRRLNEDRVFTPSVFGALAGDCEIEFKLAKRTPDGQPCNGIVRYSSTRRTTWGKNDDIKMPEKGGVAPWNPSKYLNIYVCAIGSGILGYSTMPGTTPEMDGVVIDYRYFGTMGTAVAPFNKGRTATHEIGHWLNLRHIWGDNDCGDDSVSDTPVQEGPNYGCNAFPHISCGDKKIGDMFMNFMDYSDDDCMNMFTSGQKSRIQALFSAGGVRASFLNSDALVAPYENCPTPSKLAVSGVSTKSVTLKWDAAEGVNEYLVEYHSVESPKWLCYTVKNSTVSTILNLMPDKSYECRVKSVCINTESAYSTIAQFKTLSTYTNESCNDLYEPNNSFTTAKIAPVNIAFNATIGTNSDNDYFVFKTTDEQKNIRINLSNLPYDYDVRLYNVNHKLIASSTKYDRTDEKIVINDAPVGYYYVRIYSNGKSSAAICYRLSIELGNKDFLSEEELNRATMKINETLKVAPNPATDFVNVELETGFEGDAKVLLLDLTGRSVIQTTQKVTKDITQFQLNVNNVRNGLYVLAVKCDEKVMTQKVMINNSF